jgi:hypothetical protein
MPERWMPLLAATVGLLGGVGGAYIGGVVAIKEQQERFENEQRTETRNLRINAYVDLLKACETTFYIDESLSKTQTNQRVGDLRAAQARASLMTSSNEVQTAAGTLGPNEGACGDIDLAQHISAQQTFVDAAKPEVTADE